MAFMPMPGPMQTTRQPLAPPPNYIPEKPAVSYIVDCINQYTYVWLWNGDRFWFYPTRVEYGEISGYRWTGTFWAFYGIDPRFVEAVSCAPIPTLY